MTAVRAGTVSTRAPFVEGLVDMVLERAAAERGDEVEPVTVGSPRRVAEPAAVPGCCRLRAGEDSGVPAACGSDPAAVTRERGCRCGRGLECERGCFRCERGCR